MNAESTTAQEPGVYEDVPAEVYHSWPYASNSRLGHLVPPSTPAHLKAHLDQPPKDKKVWREGRILHACVLEPERYERDYRRARQCMSVTSKGAQCSREGVVVLKGGEIVCAQHAKGEALADELIVSRADDDMARACRARFAAHAIAGGFLRVSDARTELSLVWDQHLGDDIVVRCKARLDFYSPTFMGGLPMDYKGARDASEREIRKQAFYNGYLRQSVLYRMGLGALGLPARTFALVAQEKVPPYELMVYLVGDEATGPLPAPGEQAYHVPAQVLALLRLWHRCRTTGEYPGYAERVRVMTADEWMWAATDEATAIINERVVA